MYSCALESINDKRLSAIKVLIKLDQETPTTLKQIININTSIHFTIVFITVLV